MDGVVYRLLQKEEVFFLKEMLFQALFVPPEGRSFPKSILEEPNIQKYISDWGRSSTDLAIMAIHEDAPVGVVWGRTFLRNNKGYGFVDDNTPEICMATEEAFRGYGIGTQLLQEIELAYQKIGIKQLSLSVDKLNPAKRLYERSAYVLYEEAGTAITMLKHI